MNEEIASGIRNALERGYSLEQTVQSFLNAGYNPNEVREAQQSFSKGQVSTVVYPEHTSPPKNSFHAPTAPLSNESDNPKKKSSKWMLILIIILSSLVFLGALSYLIFVLLGS